MGLLNNDEGNLVYITPHDASTTDDTEVRRLVLTATENYSRTDKAVVTNYPVSSGGSHSDHYRYDAAVVSFRGVISPQSLTLIQAITGERLPTVQDYITNIRKIMTMLVKDDNTRTSPLVNVHLPDGNTVTSAVITSFKISRDVKVSDGYYVDVSLKEVLFADTRFTVSAKTDSQTEEVDKGEASSQELNDSNIEQRVQDRLGSSIFNVGVTP